MADNTQKTTVEVAVNGQEAREEMKRLQAEADMWRDKMIAASQAGDDKAFKKAEASLRKVNSQLRTMQRNQVDVNKTVNNLSSASVNEINRAIREMNRQLNNGSIARGSKEWSLYQTRIRLCREELAKINAEGKASKSWIDQFNDGFSRFGTIAATAIAALTGVSMQLASFRKKSQEKESSQANLAALTGLDDESIAWLTRQAERLSTQMDESGLRIRQSAKEILDAYALVGSNKPELLADKEALNAVTVETMRLSAAANMELKPAVDATTTALNQFGEGADQAQRYVNVLAAGSKVGAANVEQQAAVILKAGVAAKMASLSIEQLTGLTETLAEKGIKAEMAGTGLKTFLLRLETGAKDTRPSVVGLSKALDNLAAHADDTAWLKKNFGDEAVSVAKILIDARKSVQSYTDAVSATSIATEQAAINSNTAAAKMAQMKNEMNELGIELMKTLNPAITRGISLFVHWERSFITILRWINDNKASLAILAAGIAYYTVVMNAATLATKAHTVWQKVVAIWNDRLITSFKALTAAMMKNPWGLIAVGIASAVVYLKRYSDRLKETARQEEQLARRRDVSAEMTERINEAYSKEVARVQVLVNSLRGELLSREAKLRVLKQLQQIIPGYNAELDKEGRIIRENTAALDEYLNKRMDEMRAKAVEEEMEQLVAKQVAAEKRLASANDAVKERNKAWQEYYQTHKAVLDQDIQAYENTERNFKLGANAMLSAAKAEVDGIKQEIQDLVNFAGSVKIPQITTTGGGGAADDGKDRIKQLTAEYERAAEAEKRAALSTYTEILNANVGVSEQEVATRKKAAEEYAKAVYDVELHLLEQKRDLYAKGSAEYAAADSKVLDKIAQRDNELAMAAVKAEADAAEARIKATEDAAKAAMELLKKYQARTKDEVYRADLAALDDALARKLISEEQYAEAVKNLRLMVYAEEYQQLRKSIKDRTDSYEKQREDIARILSAQIADIDAAEQAGTISHEEAERRKVTATEAANQAIKDLNNDLYAALKQGLDMFVSSFSSMMSSLSSYFSAACDMEVADAEKSWDAQIVAAEKAGRNTTALEEQKQKDIADIKTRYNERAGKIEIAQAVAQGAMAAINAYSSAAAIPVIGYILAPIAAAMALAATGVQIAAIKKQQQAQASGYYEGGFTRRTDDDHEPVGVVHGNEFVANHKTVANPRVRPYLDAIDYAQKNNTESTLSFDDVIPKRQYYAGGYTPVSPSVTAASAPQLYSDAEVKAMLRKLTQQLDSGIYAYTTVDGPDGIARKQHRYNTLINNKRR